MARRLAAVLAIGVVSASTLSTVHSSSLTTALGSDTSDAQSDVSSDDEAASGFRGRQTAIATLKLADGSTVGHARFSRAGSDTRVSVKLRMPEVWTAAGGSFHGFHVHANDNPDNGTGCVADADAASPTWFVSADAHYEQADTDHAHHAGDMPVIYLQQDGWAKASFVTDRFRVPDVIGRAVIVHAKPDNYGNIPVGTAPTDYTPVDADEAPRLTKATGNASDRVVCGVIRTS